MAIGPPDKDTPKACLGKGSCGIKMGRGKGTRGKKVKLHAVGGGQDKPTTTPSGGGFNPRDMNTLPQTTSGKVISKKNTMSKKRLGYK